MIATFVDSSIGSILNIVKIKIIESKDKYLNKD